MTLFLFIFCCVVLLDNIDLLQLMGKSECDQAAPIVLKVFDFNNRKKNKEQWYSDSFFAFEEGYQMCLRVDAAGNDKGEGTHVSVYLYLMKGPHDDEIEQSGHWPLRGTFTIELLNQLNDSSYFIYTKPLYYYLCHKCTMRVKNGDIAPKGWYNKHFISRKAILYHNTNHYFGNDLHFKISYKDSSSSTPHDLVAPVVFSMCNVTDKLRKKERWYSVPFLAFKGGYRMCLVVCMAGYNIGEGSHVSAYVFLMKGPHDDELEKSGHWPSRGRFTIELLNQHNYSDHHYHNATLDNKRCSRCTKRVIKDNIASSGWGSHQYLSHKVIVSDKYCNNDCVHFRISYEDTKSLLLSDQIAPAMLKMDNHHISKHDVIPMM